MSIVGIALASLPANTRMWMISFFTGIGMCVFFFRIYKVISAWITQSITTRMTEAINAESIKYSAKLSIPITWRLHVTSEIFGSGQNQQVIKKHFVSNIIATSDVLLKRSRVYD
jgi:hypothetical protein